MCVESVYYLMIVNNKMIGPITPREEKNMETYCPPIYSLLD